jgi:hypothetical protein
MTSNTFCDNCTSKPTKRIQAVLTRGDIVESVCRKVQCKTCNLATWAGCGAHIEQVLGAIPQAQRCQGHTNEASKQASNARDSWFRRLLKR